MNKKKLEAEIKTKIKEFSGLSIQTTNPLVSTAHSINNKLYKSE